MKAAADVVELLEELGLVDVRDLDRLRALEYKLDELLAEHLDAAHRRGVLEALGAELDLSRYV